MNATGKAPALHQVYLHIGEGGVFLRPTVIHTVLGSCVAVVLHAPQHQATGVFHAFLPCCPGAELEDGEPAFRYVDTGIHCLIHLFARRSIPAAELVAKLFGGAGNMGIQGGESVGTRNVAVARATLAAQGIPILAECVGGRSGCKILVFSSTGEVLLRRLRSPMVSPNPGSSVHHSIGIRIGRKRFLPVPDP